MTLEKKYSITNGHNLWRIKISQNEKLYIETRDKGNKEVYFGCYILEDGTPVFENHQFQEKFWIGIEEIYKDIIFLHKYPKPDMPYHAEIIAFDSASQKTLWENKDYSFSFIDSDKVYAKKEIFGNVEYAVFDYLTGEKIEKTLSDQEIEILGRDVKAKFDYDSYIFPEVYHPDSADVDVEEILKNNIGEHELTGNIEFAIKHPFIFASVHLKASNGKMDNYIYVIDSENNTKSLEIKVNSNLELFAADTFFIYKTYLFVLSEQKELIVYSLEE